MNYPKFSRRSLLATAFPALAGTLWGDDSSTPPRRQGVPMIQEPLGFDLDALEPYLDARTLKIHYHEHHAAHLREFRRALDEVDLMVGNAISLMPCIQAMKRPPLVRQSILQLSLAKSPSPTGVQQPLTEDVQRRIRVHGGAHVNHTAFWRFLRPTGSGAYGPLNNTASALNEQFGTVQQFKEAFTQAALAHFGPGWAWLIYRNDGTLAITTTPDEDNPLMKEFVDWHEQGRPILALDLWEHSYYLKFKNNRRAYVDAWWKVVNWEFVEKALAIVTKMARY